MKIICGLAMMSLLAWGQDAAPKPVERLIQLRYVDASRANNLAAVFAGGRTLQLQADDHLHFIAVRGPAETVAAFEEAVKKIDVPPIDFDLTVYLVSGSNQPGDQLPEALASTAKQLHGVFAYKGYQLLESFVLRGRDGRKGTANGTISANGKSSTYSFRYEEASVSGDAPKTINFRYLNLNLQFRTGGLNKEGQPIFHETGLSTDIDVRDGQKVVVGKSDMNNGESPLILVVTAKVVE
jgi:hypothetical protein